MVGQGHVHRHQTWQITRPLLLHRQLEATLTVPADNGHLQARLHVNTLCSARASKWL